jgi:hypothetical protein
MVIPIPYALDYTAKLSGSVPKLVRCEQCSLEYVYLMKRSASGEGTSMLFLDNEGAQARAQSAAERALTTKLDHELDPIPCLACGWYQADMVAEIRKGRLWWMVLVAVGLGILGVILFLMACLVSLIGEEPVAALVMWIGVGLCALGAISLPLARRRLARQYDPNMEDLEQRKQFSATRAITKEAFLKWIEEQQKTSPESPELS